MPTPLSKIARYYLACMDQDECQASVFAESRYGDPDYVELDSTEHLNYNGIFRSPQVHELMGKIRKDRSRLEMFFGYPSTLTLIKSNRSNWSGYKIEPIILFPVTQDTFGLTDLKVDWENPIVNHRLFSLKLSFKEIIK